MFKYIVAVWVAAGLIWGFSVPPAQDLVATPIAFLHVPMAIGMLGGFLMAAWYGVLWLRKRQPRHDALSLAFAEVGAVMGVIATISGSLWSRLNWGAYWSWDPQQIGIVATLLTYGALFTLRGALDDETRRRNAWAVYALLGVLAAVFWTVIFRRLGWSLHPEAPLLESSDTFKWALRFNIVGALLLLTQISLLRARLETARERLTELAWRRDARSPLT